MSDSAELVGGQIAYHRKRLGLSQAELAALVGRSESWVSQVERGVRAVDRMSVLQRVADALGIAVSDLRDTEQADTQTTSRPEVFEYLRLALTGHPAVGAILGDTRSSLTKREFAQLAKTHSQVWPLVHAGRY